MIEQNYHSQAQKCRLTILKISLIDEFLFFLSLLIIPIIIHRKQDELITDQPFTS